MSTTIVSGVRNRNHTNKLPPQVTETQTSESLLIEKLDAFLSSIELRLERFERYFQVVGAGASETLVESEGNGKNPTQSHNRRGSTASLSSLKTLSATHMNQVYEQLRSVKDHVLQTSITNLEYLYKTLDEKYNDLFSNDESSLILPEEDVTNEALSTNIINTIQFFEQKLSHIDQFIKSRTPAATDNYDHDSKFNRFRFFNFNKALKEAEEKYLHYYQLPLSWRENRYIIHGYRFSLQHKDILKSMFHFNHNETGNIWTHIIGTVLMLYLGLVHFPKTDVFAANTWVDNMVMYVFLLAAIECLVSSVLWHTYSCFAHLQMRNRFACVDYTGITVLITCSVISAEYCALYNSSKLLYLFVGFSIISGLSGLLFNWSPYFDKPECRPLRIVFFVCLALLGGTTFLCKWRYEGFLPSLYFYLPLVYNSFVWYWTGVVFYGGLIPERWRYDIIINEDSTCRHTHTTSDVLTGHIENCGEEEMEEMEHEMEELGLHEELDSVSVTVEAEDSDSEDKIQDILAKHFPAEPMRTPYHRDLFSLWWVDYILSSHNIWHVCVVLGVTGHYFSLLSMYRCVRQIS